MKPKRIAVLTGQADEEYQSNLLSGFLDQAIPLGIDVCVFSMYIKYQNSTEREIGDSNIFQMINFSVMDAVLILADTIQTPGLMNQLEEQVYNHFQGPVLCVDWESQYFPTIWTDGYPLIYSLINHLIHDHHKSDIAFLSGKPEHPHSQRRVQAYRDAMEANGLTVSEERIYYGDFWYTSGAACAENLVEADRNQETSLPEAIACANDVMAIGLSEALIARGIRIPEDILVTGYGSTFEGRTSPISITSAFVDSREYGAYFFQCLMALCENRSLPAYQTETKLFLGGSCGCNRDFEPHVVRETWSSIDSENSFLSIHNTIQEDMMRQTTFRGFLEVVISHLYQLDHVCDFHIFLNENWTLGSLETGYTDSMLHVIDYENYGVVSRMNEYRLSDRTKMLEELYTTHTPAKGYYFTPLFFETVCFGYAVVGYGREGRTYDLNYRFWINAVSRGLEVIRRTMELERLSRMKEILQSQKTGFIDNSKMFELAIAELREEQRSEMEQTRQLLENNQLEYFFQPIVDAHTGEVYSHEALMRSGAGYHLSPVKILHYAKLLQMLPTVEYLTFMNVLGLMETSEKLKNKTIFINGIPGIFLDEKEQSQIRPKMMKMVDRVVVEMTEANDMNVENFLELMEGYRMLGVHYAIDDYGVGYANVSNLLRYMPDVVKIDRSLITNIQKDVNKQHFVREVIEFCRNSQIKSLAEGVETAEELHTLIHMGVDFLQGYYLGRPAADPVNVIDRTVKNEIRRFYDEYERGEQEKVYYAGKTNLLNLGNLAREGYSKIIVGGEQMTYRDLEIIGSPGLRTEITMEVQEGYRGNITLDNVSFGSVKNRQCIDLAPGSDVKIHLKGENQLRKKGIRVPVGAHLSFEGSGNLRIMLDSAEYFGIGNDVRFGHGTIDFRQEGEINIYASGQYGIGIGSGLGGEIHIRSGSFSIRMDADEAVGIGSLQGNMDLKLEFCEIHIIMNASRGVAIGSVSGEVNLYAMNSSVSSIMEGKQIVSFGSVDGKAVKLRFSDLNVTSDIRADQSTVVGSLKGMTLFVLERASFLATSSGKRALIFGGENSMATIRIENANTYSELLSEQNRDTYASEDDFLLINGRSTFLVNGSEVVRKTIEVSETNKGS